MNVTGKLLIWFVLATGVAACFKGSREKTENFGAGSGGKPPENVNRLDGQTSTVIPSSPETLTTALSRNRRDKIEAVSDSEIFQKNDGVRLKISAVENGFVTVLYKGSDDNYLKLFPNKSYNKGKNSIAPNQILEIPDRGWLFFDEKKGVETIYVVYSKTVIPNELAGEPKKGFTVLDKLRSENNNSDAFADGDGNLVRIVKLTHE